jgi:tetratricopeptide (TPR) repeat protein
VLLICVAGATVCAAAPREDLWASGHADETLRQVSKAKTADAYNLLCRVHWALENWDEAAKSCEVAVQLNPNVEEYQLWLGRAYGSKAEHAGPFSAFALARKSVAAFEKAVQLNPKDMRARHDLAEYYANAPGIVGGGKGKALKLADEIAGTDPVNAAFIRGMTAMEDKNPSEAEKQFQLAVKASNNSAEALLKLAHFYKKQSRWNEFDSAMSAALNASGKNPEDLFEAGELLVGSRRNPVLAIATLNRYLSGTTTEYGPAFRAHFLAGQALEMKGDRGKAIEHYKAALALASGYRRAQEALRNLGA